MHPIKAFESIQEAYFTHGVRTFSLDSLEEVQKILEATQNARDLTLCVRLRVSSEHSKLSLGSKFGTYGEEAVAVLQACRQVALRVGVCFHVGSQTMDPCAYTEAMEIVRALICASGVVPDVVDVGGGFPSVYPGMTPPPMQLYFDTIKQAFESLNLPASTLLWAEPGRSLCNEYSSVLVRVEHKRNQQLYINDGAYGALFDAAHINWLFPTQLLRDSAAPKAAYAMWGPTCDDMDYMPGPFHVPEDVRTGDYMEVGMLGAYGSCMRTNFNGFVNGGTVEVCDPAMASMYHDDAARCALENRR
jgi:ornithine decarboxylase